MMPLYRIKDWAAHFENNRTKELKHMTWVPMPNKMDGDGYTELLDHANGAAHFGAWCALVEIASKCDVRGTLLREGSKPHDPSSLARISRMSATVFNEALPRLEQIGWIESLDQDTKEDTAIPHEDAAIPQKDAPRVCAGARGRERNGMEGNGTERISCPPSADVIARISAVDVYREYPRHVGRRKALREIEAAAKEIRKRPGVDNPYTWLTAKVRAYARARQAVIASHPAEARYTPLPATWFHQGRYDDESDEWGTVYSDGKHPSQEPGWKRSTTAEQLDASVADT